jgi:hypothetical protein
LKSEWKILLDFLILIAFFTSIFYYNYIFTLY